MALASLGLCQRQFSASAISGEVVSVSISGKAKKNYKKMFSQQFFFDYTSSHKVGFMLTVSGRSVFIFFILRLLADGKIKNIKT